LMTQSVLEALQPASVSPGLLALVSESAPNRAILCAGAGSFERAYITLTRGVHVGSHDRAADEVLSRWAGISDRAGEIVPEAGSAQGQIELEKAGFGAVTGEGT